MYAKRWEKSGNPGYAPAAIMDWNAIRAAKPEDRKRAARKTRSLIPLTDQAVRDHLKGKSTIGVYPRGKPIRLPGQVFTTRVTRWMALKPVLSNGRGMGCAMPLPSMVRQHKS